MRCLITNTCRNVRVMGKESLVLWVMVPFHGDVIYFDGFADDKGRLQTKSRVIGDQAKSFFLHYALG